MANDQSVFVVEGIRGPLTAMALAPAAALRGASPRMGGPTRAGRLAITSMFAAAVSFAAVVFFVLWERKFAPLPAHLIFSAIGAVIARRAGRRDLAIFVIVNSVATIGAIALYQYYVGRYGVPYWLGGSDELHFEAMGAAFADQTSILNYAFIRSELVPSGHNSVGYIYVVGVFTEFGRFFDAEHTMIPRMFNATCLGLIAVGVNRLARRLEMREAVATATALVVGCLPLMVWTSVQTFRDIPLTLLLLAIVLLWTPSPPGAKQRAMSSRLVMTAIVVVAISELRMAQALVAVLIAAASFVAAARIRVRWVIWSVVLASAAAWVAATQSASIGATIDDYVEQAAYYATYRVEVTGGGLSTVVFQTPPPLGYVLRVAYALASPIPIPGPNLDELARDSGTIVHLMFVPYLVLGLGMTFRLKAWRAVVAAFGLLFVGMAMFTFQIRHIVQYLPFAALIAAWAFDHHRRSYPSVFGSVLILLSVLAITYVGLKG